MECFDEMREIGHVLANRHPNVFLVVVFLQKSQKIVVVTMKATFVEVAKVPISLLDGFENRVMVDRVAVPDTLRSQFHGWTGPERHAVGVSARGIDVFGVKKP